MLTHAAFDQILDYKYEWILAQVGRNGNHQISEPYFQLWADLGYYERILALSFGRWATTGPIGLESWLQEALLFIPWGEFVSWSGHNAMFIVDIAKGTTGPGIERLWKTVTLIAILWFSDLVTDLTLFWQSEKVESGHCGLVTDSQRVTWTAFAILAICS